MSKPKFAYVTYIRTTSEKLWQALIEPEFTRQYLGRHLAGIGMAGRRAMACHDP